MTLTNLFSDIANAIRAKTGGTAPIVAADFPAAIAGISGGGKATKMINIDWSGDEENICEVEYISNNELVVVRKSDGVNTIDAEGGIVKANIGNNGYFSSGFLVLHADEGDRYVLVAAKDGETISPVSSTAQ